MRYFESPSCQWQLESHSITCKIFNMSGARPLRAELPAIEFNREIQYTFSLWFILTDILMESTPKLGEREKLQARDGFVLMFRKREGLTGEERWPDTWLWKLDTRRSSERSATRVLRWVVSSWHCFSAAGLCQVMQANRLSLHRKSLASISTIEFPVNLGKCFNSFLKSP